MWNVEELPGFWIVTETDTGRVIAQCNEERDAREIVADKLFLMSIGAKAPIAVGAEEKRTGRGRK